MPAVTADVVELELRARTAAYLSNIAAAEKQFNKRMALMASSADVMEKKVTASGNRMSRMLNRAIAAIAVGAAIKNVQELADSWTAAANKLSAAGVKIEQVGSTQQRLADLARSTRTEFDGTVNTYARLTRATADLGATQAQVTRATEIINKAVKAGGASTQEQASAILQLTQALASGQLQGDELRAIRENSPLLARAIAKEFNTTVGGLKKLGSEGKLEVSRVFKAILDGGQAIDAQFATTRSTIGETFTSLKTEAGRFLNEFDRATGATSGIANFVNKIADDFDLLAEAVVVAAAVVSTALGVRMTRALAQTAVQNSAFVRSLMDGTVGLDLQAEAARKAARDTLLLAQADKEAAREGIVATRQRINNLEAEAVSYRQNIALAEAQRAAAARQFTTGRDAGGAFVSRADANTARNNATKALIANRMQLSRVTRELTAAELTFTGATNTYTAAAERSTIAQRTMRAAMVETSIVSRAASVAMTGLSAAMSFFGGPIGVAIIAVAGALAYFATEAAKAAVAGENAQAVLDNLQSGADQTRTHVDQLSKGLKENKTAADKSAEGARNAAKAYNEAGVAAGNAAEMIKYMTAAQRQSELEKVRAATRDLDKAIGGFNPLGTNAEERVANARNRILKTQGLQGGGAFGGSETFIQQAFAKVAAGKATKEEAAAVLEYKNAVAVLNDNLRRRNELLAAGKVIEEGISSPTLKKPTPDTSNLIPQPTGSSGKGHRGRDITEQQLENERQMLDLENRINLARAAGAEDLADFLSDQREYFEQFNKYIKSARDEYMKETGKRAPEGFGVEEARAKAAAQVEELRTARDTAQAHERAAEIVKERAAAEEHEQERILDLRRQNLAMQERQLQLDLEIAEAAGNSEKVKELERQLELLGRIRDYEDRGSPPGEADTRAKEDQDRVDHARNMGKVKDVFKDGVRAAFDGDLKQYISDFWKDALIRANDKVIDNLFDAIEQALKKIDWSAIWQKMGGNTGNEGWGEIFSQVAGAVFGTSTGAGSGGVNFTPGRAGGGNMQRGRFYKVGENGEEIISVGNTARAIPNSAYRASERGGGGGNIAIQLVNNTGVPAKAKSEKMPGGGAKIKLEPLFESGVEGAGASGALMRGLRQTPRPVKRA